MTIPGMNWYVAKLVYQIVRGNSSTGEFDVQWRIIQADEQDWAVEKSNTLGRLGESIFFNSHKQEVHWKFLGVVDLIKIKTLDDTTLLYSQTEEPTDNEMYVSIMKDRAERFDMSTSLISLN